MQRLHKQSEHVPIDREDMFEYEEESPEWLDLLGNAEFKEMELGNFQHNDWSTRTHNHSELYGTGYGANFTKADLPTDITRWWQDKVNEERGRRERLQSVHLFDDDPYKANDEQMGLIALLLHSMFWRLEGEAAALQKFPQVACCLRRILLLGRPGAGKSYVLRCAASIVRMC